MIGYVDETFYDVLAGDVGSKLFQDVNMGFINSQAAKAGCVATRATKVF